ncbi:hypothetical protein PP639_gp013 [Arthrobacter phage Seahorse]|uniref:Uncharacterized protein n=1 Tax=Arthrobacter phage Seahorse TaxID=2419611 RepID=A0A3G3M658_9CAUD|nr:hypothetical protein PP639_gp013 [Arthrobacter phage Seahorse]AYR01514.1 hypothetical protein PBI_SEAHORSE_13 [Arthrobacter phage Seahorse]
MSDGAAEFRQLSNDLGRIAGHAVKDVDEVLKKGAQNVKTEMVADASASEHFKGMAGSISYDSRYSIGTPRYEVGPDKGRRGGALGNIAYFGTSRGGGTLDIEKPLRNEEPRLTSALEDLADRWAGQI